MRNSSRRVALCGLLCALAVVMMLLGGVIPAAVYCCPILAMVILLPVRELWGPRIALTAYAAVCILSMLLTSNVEQVFVYLFLGWYPAVQPRLDRLARLPRILAKLVLFNAAVLSMYALLLRVFRLEAVADDLSGIGGPMLVLLLLMGNLVFFMTDLLLRRISRKWSSRWKSF